MLDFFKRPVVLLYVRAIREHQRRQADASERIADAVELLLKLQVLRADISLEALKDAEEMPAAAQVPAAAGPFMDKTLEKAAMEFIGGQSPEELDRLDAAFEHAESRMGRGKVPPDLDLAMYADSLEPDSVEEQP